MRVASDVGGTFTDLVYVDVVVDEAGRQVSTITDTAKTDQHGEDRHDSAKLRGRGHQIP